MSNAKEGQTGQNLLLELDNPDNLVEGKGRDRWNLTKKAKYLAALLGTSASLSLITACNSTPTTDLVNESNTTVTPVTLTVENPQLTPTPLIINTPSSTPSPEKSATAEPEKVSTPPPGSKIVNSENRWGPVVDKGIEVWTGDTWEKHNLPEYDMVLDTKNNLIGVIDRKTGSYLVIQDSSVFPLKVKDPAKDWPTPTPPATAGPTSPSISPPPTDKTPTTQPPEVGPSATSTPELVRPWPEKIGNMETDKIEIYNHGKEIGVISTNWGEITYLAKKLADIGVKVKGYEFHFYDSTQTALIPVDSNATYDQNINWSKNYVSSTNGKKYWKVRPDGILDVRITLPKILENYTGAGKGYVLAQLDYDLDSTIADNLCNKGQFGINASCDPETQAFVMRSYHFQNYKDDLQNPAFSNLKAQFPTTK